MRPPRWSPSLPGLCVPAALSVCPRQVVGSKAGAQSRRCFVMRVCGQDTGEQASHAESGI